MKLEPAYVEDIMDSDAPVSIIDWLNADWKRLSDEGYPAHLLQVPNSWLPLIDSVNSRQFIIAAIRYAPGGYPAKMR